MEAEGPRRIHRSSRDVDRATHVLHIDIAGPFFATSDDGFAYFLVGVLRFSGFPLLIDVRLLTSCTSMGVCDALEKMVAFFESLEFEGFALTPLALSVSIAIVLENLLLLSLYVFGPKKKQNHLPHLYLWLRLSGRWNC